LAPRDKIARVNHDACVAFAHGLSILVFAAALGEISGGHFYLAVTIGLATAGGFQAVASRLTLSPNFAGGIAAWVLLPALTDRWPTLTPHWSISATFIYTSHYKQNYGGRRR
jgi:glycerol uptake facilitator-like aquaporin